MRVLVSPGFSEGHALPALALTRRLLERGHEVTVELSRRWREPVLELGASFTESEEYVPFPGAWPATDDPTVVDRAAALAPVLAELKPRMVVADFASPAPALAGELARIPVATLIPTVYPVQDPAHPPLLTGLAPPRTSVGRSAWRAAAPLVRAVRPSDRWNRRVPALLDDSRHQLGLPPLGPDAGPLTTYGPLRGRPVMVATFPQLEYPRRWPASTYVTGPLPYELSHPEVALPPGDQPLVLIAPSTVPDPRRELIATALEALADEPVRVLATLNRRDDHWTGPIPANARVTDWVSYSQAMRAATLVITSGGIGTVQRALCEGKPVLICPSGADTAENAARVTHAGAGVALPRRMLSRRTLRLAVRWLLTKRAFGDAARSLQRWNETHDGATAAAILLERYCDGSW